MLYKEKRAQYYTFFIEDESLKDYTTEDETLSLLRWRVSENLFQYLDKKFFIEDNPEYLYKFTHPDVNIVLITDDTSKVEQLSFFLSNIMNNNQLMEIYSDSISKNKFSKKYEIDQKIFKSKLDKAYDYFVLNSELSKSNNNTNKKVKI